MKLLEILRCPGCQSPLMDIGEVLSCFRCGVRYPVIDGIPDLVPDFVDERTTRRINAWSHLGYDYDELIARTHPERLRAIDAPLLERCGGGQLVLEVGCGTARLSDPVSAAGSRYIGIDPSLTLLRHAVSRAPAGLVRGVGEYLPFADGSFDVVIGGYCSFRYIQLERLYGECHRVLRPDGVLAFTLWNNWSLFLHGVLDDIRRRDGPVRPFRINGCNDVVSPVHELRRLARFGFAVESLLSTRNVPLLSRLPVVGSHLGWRGYWHGALAAFVGYDLIFLCRAAGERGSLRWRRGGSRLAERRRT